MEGMDAKWRQERREMYGGNREEEVNSTKRLNPPFYMERKRRRKVSILK
jgi:hypothetical protein